MLDQTDHLEIIDRAACLQLLASTSVGRLGFISGGWPEILPVNYALDGDAIVFVTNAGTKLWGVTRSPVVFEVDAFNESDRSGWSVVVRGVAQEVTPHDASYLIDRLNELRPNPWAGGNRPHVVRIAGDHVSGRRISAAARSEA